ADAEMRADTSVASSSGSPTTRASTSGTSASRKEPSIDSCTYTRWVEMHDCPAWLYPATAIFAATASTSAPGSMITGALLPSSSPTFFRGARARIAQPTSGEPVNVIIATSGWSTSASPTTAAGPVTTLNHPGGRPQSSSSNRASPSAEHGVWDAGLSTT